MHFCWVAIHKPRLLVILLFVAFAIFLNPGVSHSKFYKYVDEKGNIHFVDSKGKIPKQFRKDFYG